MARNLFSNDDFESGVFSPWGTSVLGSSTITINSTDAFQGSYCAEFNVDGSNSYANLYQTNVCEIGQEYTVTFWARKTSSGSATITSEYTTGGSWTLTKEWQKFSRTFVAIHTSFGIKRNSAPGETFLIDKVRLEPTPVKYGVVRQALGDVVGSGVRFEIDGFGNPKAAIIFCGNVGTSDGGYWTAGYSSIGFWDSDDNMRCSWIASQNGVDTTLVERGLTTDSVVRRETSGALRAEYSASGVANGIIITMDYDNFSYNDTATVILIGGPEVEAHVDSFEPHNTNGGIVSETSLGFRPDCMFAICPGADAESTTQGVQSFGVATGYNNTITQRSTYVWDFNAQDTTKNGSWVSEEYIGGQCFDNAVPAIDWGAKITQFTYNGFTVETGEGSTGGDDFGYLAIKAPGINFDLKTISTKTSTGNQAYDDLNFQPGFLITSLTSASGIDAHSDGVSVTYGAGDVTDAACFGFQSADNVDTSATGNTAGEKFMYLMDDSNGLSDLVVIEIDSVNPSGYILNYTTADAISRQGWILAIQDPDYKLGIGTASGKIYFKV